MCRYLKAIRAKGGFSLNKKSKSPDKGYMVSLNGYEQKIPENNLNSEVIKQYMNTHKKVLQDNYFGAWLDNGIVYLDISKNILDKYEAIRLALECNQIGIYEVETQSTIKV